jgi:Sigma-70, region 4
MKPSRRTIWLPSWSARPCCRASRRMDQRVTTAAAAGRLGELTGSASAPGPDVCRAPRCAVRRSPRRQPGRGRQRGFERPRGHPGREADPGCERPVAQPDLAEDDSAEGGAERERDELRRHLSALSDRERDALAVRFGAGLKAAEVGAVLGVSETAAPMLVYAEVLPPGQIGIDRRVLARQTNQAPYFTCLCDDVKAAKACSAGIGDERVETRRSTWRA